MAQFLLTSANILRDAHRIFGLIVIGPAGLGHAFALQPIEPKIRQKGRLRPY
ncbi:hypothetical protein ACG74X_11480 [Marivita sp. S0852]|uniref:hypothetical protein n=1 Tax=Marivita sp. S0852 TaxID=3373893 RepID=UPI003981FC9A